MSCDSLIKISKLLVEEIGSRLDAFKSDHQLSFNNETLFICFLVEDSIIFLELLDSFVEVSTR